MATAPQTVLPPLYQRPVALSRDAHGAMSYAAPSDHRFAAGLTTVPLVLQELAIAQQDYAIAFSANSPAVPFAILGTGTSGNVFVGADGRWEPGRYIPAYVRRYPWILAERAAGTTDHVLCVDEPSGALVPGDANPLFRDGAQTAVVDAVLKQCVEFQQAHQQTALFTRALETAELLVARDIRAQVHGREGEMTVMSNVRLVDADRLRQLDQGRVLDWWQRGWLALIHAQLFSMARLNTAVDRAVRRAAGAGAA